VHDADEPCADDRRADLGNRLQGFPPWPSTTKSTSRA
jgi:hypothetical protein